MEVQVLVMLVHDYQKMQNGLLILIQIVVYGNVKLDTHKFEVVV